METSRLLTRHLLPDVADLTLSYLEPEIPTTSEYANLGFDEKITHVSKPSGIKRALASLTLGYVQSVKKYRDNTYDTARGLGSGGHLDLIKKMLKADSDSLLAIFIGACSGGQIECVQYLITQGIGSDLGKFGIYHACTGHHLKVLTILNAKGWNSLNCAMWGACFGGHLDLALCFIGAGADYFNAGLYHACMGGHDNTTFLMMDHGANDYAQGLAGACVGGHLVLAKVMVKMHQYHAPHLWLDFAKFMDLACDNNNPELVEYMLSCM
jgi:hypothetical protein